ncbi:probable glutamate receptor isoform X2 [Dermacentor albipictus]
MAAPLLRMLHAAECVANTVDLSDGRSGNLPSRESFPWTRDAQRKFKILLVNASHDTVYRLLEPLSPLKAQIGAVCHLALPENSTLKEFVEPLVPFRSLKCCRALNIGFGQPDVPQDLIALEQRAAGGVTLILYAANDFRIACTYCGFMRRRNNRFDYLPGLSGAHLLVSAVNNTPYVVVDKRGPDGEFQVQEGVELSLLKAISQRLNFTYSLNVDSPEYGALKNGTWTGLIGDVLYRESHLAISEISFTRQRTEVISYLYPVLYDVLSYVTKAPRVIPFAMAIIKPFNENTWTLLVLSVAMSTAFLFILRWSPASTRRRDTPDFWFLISTLSRQNPWEEEHPSAGYRVFLGPWWLFVTVLTTLYSGRLVAIMSVAVHDTWISDLDTLEKALVRREVRVCTHSKTIFIEYIKVATSGAFYQVRVNQLERDGGRTVLVSNRQTGLNRALHHKYVYVDSRLSLLTGLGLVGEEDAHNLRVVRDHLGVEYCGFVFQKGCPLRETFTARSRALFETGHTLRWMSDALRFTLPPYLDPDTFANYDADVWKTPSDQGALNIIDFVGPAWLLAVGYALGLAALLLELAWVRTSRLRGPRWLSVRHARYSSAMQRRLSERTASRLGIPMAQAKPELTMGDRP